MRVFPVRNQHGERGEGAFWSHWSYYVLLDIVRQRAATAHTHKHTHGDTHVHNYIVIRMHTLTRLHISTRVCTEKETHVHSPHRNASAHTHTC